MAKAWRICDWAELYEVDQNGSAYDPEKTLVDKETGRHYKPTLKIGPLSYVRFELNNLPNRNKLRRVAGINYFRVIGLYQCLLDIAKSKYEPREIYRPVRRGWIVDGNGKSCGETMGPEQISIKFGFSHPEIILEDLLILQRADLIEVAECDYAIEDENPLGDFNYSNSGDLKNFAENRRDLRPSAIPSELKTEPKAKEQVEVKEKGKGNCGSQGDGHQETIPTEKKEGGCAPADLDCPIPGGSNSSSPGNPIVRNPEIPKSENNPVIRNPSNPVSGRGDDEFEGSTTHYSGDADYVVESGANEGHPVRGDPIVFMVKTGALDLAVEDPIVILDKLPDQNNEAMYFVLYDRAYAWFENLIPGLLIMREEASEDSRQRILSDQTTVKNRIRDAWEIDKGRLVVEVIRIMQVKKQEYENARGRIRKLMALWQSAVTVEFERCKHALEPTPS